MKPPARRAAGRFEVEGRRPRGAMEAAVNGKRFYRRSESARVAVHNPRRARRQLRGELSRRDSALAAMSVPTGILGGRTAATPISVIAAIAAATRGFHRGSATAFHRRRQRARAKRRHWRKRDHQSGHRCRKSRRQPLNSPQSHEASSLSRQGIATTGDTLHFTDCSFGEASEISSRVETRFRSKLAVCVTNFHVAI